VFAVFDLGKRSFARFDGFDSTGAAKVKDMSGGNYQEFWLGPFIQYRWKSIMLDFGYGIIGLRKDAGRADIVNTSGTSSGYFKINPKVAWYAGISTKIEISKELFFVMRIQYRARYYNTLDDLPLKENIEHGTQNITPYAGVLYEF
jgi:hypothetical protein